MPVVTTEQRHKLTRDPVSDAHIVLLEFQEDGQTTFHRAAVNNEDVVSAAADGVTDQTYVATDIDVILPGQGDGPVAVRLEMSNLSRVAGQAISRARGRVGCRLMVIDETDPDTAIIDTSNLLVIQSATGDSVRISAELGMRADLQEPVPQRRTTRPFFPGVWFAAR